jgi:ribonucleoside-diphosphate reductase alpha chain
LITGGFRAPGPDGLKQSIEIIEELYNSYLGEGDNKVFKSILVYDTFMHLSDAVLSGGIRRSATSVIFDKDDLLMLHAKTNFDVERKGVFEKNDSGKYEGYVVVDGLKYQVELDDWAYQMLTKERKISWSYIYPQRARSNNSVLILRDETSVEEIQSFIKLSRQWGDPGFVFANHPWTLFNPCFEIGFVPVTEDGRCGVQFCNLTSQNGSKITSEEKWKEAVTAATIIGTLQATYTDFKYLSNTAKELTEGEALLGVSLTGWLDNPDILLDKELQQKMAQLAVSVNQEWAEVLGIRPASRVTCVKPEGTSSKVLMAGSGVHPWHGHQYFNRVQMNKLEPVYKLFKKYNPHMCEPSVWSANGTDDVITWAITSPPNSMVKDDLDALKHLRIVKSIQRNWVLPGTTKFNEK